LKAVRLRKTYAQPTPAPITITRAARVAAHLLCALKTRELIEIAGETGFSARPAAFMRMRAGGLICGAPYQHRGVVCIRAASE
jgi:hypothetical protein